MTSRSQPGEPTADEPDCVGLTDVLTDTRAGDTDIRDLLRQRYFIGAEAAAVAAAAVVLAMVALLWAEASRTSLLAWGAAMLVAIPVPPILKRARLAADSWRYFIYPLEFLHGVLWGALPAFVLPADPVYQGIVGAVSACVLLGGSISSSQFLPAFACFTTPLVALFSYGFLTAGADGTENLVWLMLVAWVYGTSVVIDQRQLHLNLINTVKNNESLLVELEEERARMVVANDKLALAVAEADRLARTDPLTGLANRLMFDEFLSTSLRRLKLGQVERVALAYVDLDDFKSVNDRGGHRVGDQLLTSVSQRLTAAAEGDELVARIGGDELVVVSTVSAGDVLGERVRRIFDHPVALGPLTVAVSGSIGVAETESAMADDELIRQADTAQYHAKRAGGDRVVLASSPAVGQSRDRAVAARPTA